MFSLTVDEMKTIGFGNGNVPRFRPAVCTFAIDVPDDLLDANPSGLNRFTLRQTPIVAASAVPEPSTFGLLGFALTGIGLWLRRRG
jgi:PEP-CTERM motif-containing protein